MNWIIKFFAHFFSVIFHPLLMLTYMLIILLIVNPYSFGPTINSNKDVWVLILFFSTFLIPAFSVFMMKALGMVDSIDLKKRQQRTGPYIVTGIFYLWIFRNVLDNPDIPQAFKIFALGATVALFLAFFVNLFSKVSMHAVGMGGLLGMILITLLRYSYESFTFQFGDSTFQMSMNTLFVLAILLCGVVCTSRLILHAHQPRDVYGGFVLGFGAMFLSMSILGA